MQVFVKPTFNIRENLMKLSQLEAYSMIDGTLYSCYRQNFISTDKKYIDSLLSTGGIRLSKFEDKNIWYGFIMPTTKPLALIKLYLSDSGLLHRTDGPAIEIFSTFIVQTKGFPINWLYGFGVSDDFNAEYLLNFAEHLPKKDMKSLLFNLGMKNER